jgi:hypothetical protein
MLPDEVVDGVARPPRPDLPYLRDVSWFHVHAVTIGIMVGLGLYWTASYSTNGALLGSSSIIVQYVLGRIQKNRDWDKCDHEIGWHDIRKKPAFVFVGAVVAWVAVSLYLGAPAS